MIYIGNFLHRTHQEEVSEAQRRHGEFNLIVEAETRDAALELFRTRILKQRRISSFLDGDCFVYLVELLEFDKLPRAAAMILNFKSVAGDPLMPFIACSAPDEQADACRIYDWKNNGPEIDGTDNKPFLTFTGSAQVT